MSQPIFTTDWFSCNIPAISETLSKHGQTGQVQILEIGSWEGRSTVWLLERYPDATIACIDTFEGGQENQGSTSLNGLEERFRSNICVHADRVKIHKGNSGDMLFQVGPPNTFDIIYVDGSHTSWDALVDIIISFQLLKPGGIMMIDDYGGGNPANILETSPKPAVDAFTNIMGCKCRVLHVGYQFHIMKL
jgi:hypothetical protein